MANSEMNTELLAQLQQLLAQLTGQLESGYDENGDPVTRYLDGVEAAWKPNAIYQLENGHPLDGGRDGHLNRPNRDLLACIMWLKGKMDEVAAAIPGTEQFETLVDELSRLDVTLLEEKLTYLQGYQTLTNRYAKDKFWVELFSAKNTLADVFEIAVEEAIVGSDCIDVTDTVGIEPGTEYLISDSLGCEEITVTQKLTEHRIRTEEPLSRTYGEDAVIRRTSWSLPNFGSMGGDAVAQTGEVYWSVPITLNAIGREQAVYIGRDKEDGVLEIYYMDDGTEDWVELEYLTEISLSTIQRDMKYKLPPITGPLKLKVVCTEGPVRLHHIVTHLAFDANVPQETPSVDWGQIFGDITKQTDLNNALNALKAAFNFYDLVPPGLPLMWLRPLDQIPYNKGFQLADGTNNTPNLMGRYLKIIPNATTNPGGIGGSNQITLTVANMPVHSHALTNGSAVSAGGHGHGLQWRIYSGSTFYLSSNIRLGYANQTLAMGTDRVGIQFTQASIAYRQIPEYEPNMSNRTMLQCDGAVSAGSHAHTVTGTIGNTGSGTPITIAPLYYEIAIIIKVANSI